MEFYTEEDLAIKLKMSKMVGRNAFEKSKRRVLASFY